MNNFDKASKILEFDKICLMLEDCAETEGAKSLARTLSPSEDTYTVLRRLCEEGIFQNEGGQVTSLISREEFYAAQSEEFVNETFSGSLPAFLAAFSHKKKLSEDEIAALEQIIADMRK